MEHESVPEKEAKSFTYSTGSVHQTISAVCVIRWGEVGGITNWSALRVTSLIEEHD